MTIYNHSLRKLGYLVPTRPPSPLIATLDRAGCRMRAMYRMRPLDGHWIGACPFCKVEDQIFVEPGLTIWSTTCGCSTGGTILDLVAAMILSSVAA